MKNYYVLLVALLAVATSAIAADTSRVERRAASNHETQVMSTAPLNLVILRTLASDRYLRGIGQALQILGTNPILTSFARCQRGGGWQDASSPDVLSSNGRSIIQSAAFGVVVIGKVAEQMELQTARTPIASMKDFERAILIAAQSAAAEVVSSEQIAVPYVIYEPERCGTLRAAQVVQRDGSTMDVLLHSGNTPSFQRNGYTAYDGTLINGKTYQVRLNSSGSVTVVSL